MMRALTGMIDAIDHSIRFDALTGALTRSYFLEQMRAAPRDGGYILMLDADHFKSINDHFGHHVGDVALQMATRAVKSVLGPEYPVGRMGGEEFAVLLQGMSARAARTVAWSLCHAVERYGRVIEGEDVNLTVSIGAARYAAGQNPETSLRDADALLYRAKRAGRNRVVMEDEAMSGEICDEEQAEAFMPAE